MRWFLLVVTCLVLWARGGCAEEPADSVTLFSDGFAPTGAPYQVKFFFSAFPRTFVKNEDGTVRRIPFLGKSVLVWPGSGQDGSAEFDVCALKWPVGLNDYLLAVGRLRMQNAGDRPFSTTLSVTIAPRPKIHALAFERHAFFLNGRPECIADIPSRGAILAKSPFAARPLSPQDDGHVESAEGTCSGEMVYDINLAPGQSQVLGFICPIRLPNGAEPKLDFYRGLSVEDLFTAAQKQVDGSPPPQ